MTTDVIVCRRCKEKREVPRWPLHCCGMTYRWPGDEGLVGDFHKTTWGGPCIHQGAEVRREPCESCKAEVLIKIFACSIHGECSLKAGMGVKCCKACGEYVKAE